MPQMPMPPPAPPGMVPPPPAPPGSNQSRAPLPPGMPPPPPMGMPPRAPFGPHMGKQFLNSSCPIQLSSTLSLIIYDILTTILLAIKEQITCLTLITMAAPVALKLMRLLFPHTWLKSAWMPLFDEFYASNTNVHKQIVQEKTIW